MSDPNLVMMPIAELKPYKKNSKKHSESSIAKMMGYISEYGFTRHVLVWGSENQIVAGHRAWTAAGRLGFKEVPVRRVDHLSEKQMRALVIADNQSANDSPFDSEVLLEELTELADLNFNIELTGFSLDFLGDGILNAAGNPKDYGVGNEYENDQHEVIGEDERELTKNDVEKPEESAPRVLCPQCGSELKSPL